MKISNKNFSGTKSCVPRMKESLNRGSVPKERFHSKVLSNDPENKTPEDNDCGRITAPLARKASFSECVVLRATFFLTAPSIG